MNHDACFSFKISPKRGRNIAEKPLRFRRKAIGISPKRQWNLAEKASSLRRKHNNDSI